MLRSSSRPQLPGEIQLASVVATDRCGDEIERYLRGLLSRNFRSIVLTCANFGAGAFFAVTGSHFAPCCDGPASRKYEQPDFRSCWTSGASARLNGYASPGPRFISAANDRGFIVHIASGTWLGSMRAWEAISAAPALAIRFTRAKRSARNLGAISGRANCRCVSVGKLRWPRLSRSDRAECIGERMSVFVARECLLRRNFRGA
jgi:hypothetical protein